MPAVGCSGPRPGRADTRQMGPRTGQSVCLSHRVCAATRSPKRVVETPKLRKRDTVVRIPQSIYLTTVYRSKRAVRVITNALPKRQFCPFHKRAKPRLDLFGVVATLRPRQASVRTYVHSRHRRERPPAAGRPCRRHRIRPPTVCLPGRVPPLHRAFLGCSGFARSTRALLKRVVGVGCEHPITE